MSSTRADKKDLKEPLSEVPERPEEIQEQPGKKGPQEEATQSFMNKVKSEGIAEGESASNLAIKTSQGTSETIKECKINPERTEMGAPLRSEDDAEGEISNLASETSQAKTQKATQMHIGTTGGERAAEEVSLKSGLEETGKSKGSTEREEIEKHGELGDETIELDNEEEIEDTVGEEPSKELHVPLASAERQQKRKQVDNGTMNGKSNKSAKISECDTAVKTDAEEEAGTEGGERAEGNHVKTEIDDVVNSEDRISGKTESEGGEEKETNSSKQGEIKTEKAQSARYVKMAVVLKGYPKVKLTEKNAELLESVLAKKIVQTPLAITVQFIATEYEDGAVIFTCANTETKKWLLNTVPRLTLWDGAKLEVCFAKLLKPGTRMCFWVTKQMVMRTNQKILDLLEKQNNDISTKGWEILKRTTENKVARLSVWMDENSAEKIKARFFRLYLGLGRVMFKKDTLVSKQSVSNQPAQRVYQFKGTNSAQRFGPRFRAPNALQRHDSRFRPPNAPQQRGLRFRPPNSPQQREPRFRPPNSPQQREPRFRPPNSPQQRESRFRPPNPPQQRESKFRPPDPPQQRERRFRPSNPPQQRERKFMAANKVQRNESRFMAPDEPHQQEVVFMPNSPPSPHEPTYVAQNQLQPLETRFVIAGQPEIEPRFMAENHGQESKFITAIQLQPHEPRFIASEQPHYQDSRFITADLQHHESRFIAANQPQHHDDRFLGQDQASEPRFMGSNQPQPQEPRYVVANEPQSQESIFSVSGRQQFSEPRFMNSDESHFLDSMLMGGDTVHSHEARFAAADTGQTRDNRSRFPDPPSLFERRVRMPSPVHSREARFTGGDPYPAREPRSVSSPSHSRSPRFTESSPPHSRSRFMESSPPQSRSRFMESSPPRHRSVRFAESAPVRSRSSRFIESDRSNFGRYSRR